MKHVIAVMGAALVVGCQTYDFERVTPMALSQESHPQLIKATRLKPNIMMLVDSSGSMVDPVATGGSRMENLKIAMSSFLGQAGTLARFGLTVFPENDVASQTVRVALPPPTANDDQTDAALSAKATEVNDAIQLLFPNGGTPTNGSIAFVAEEPGLNNPDDGRLDFVLLLTDGLPNLNLENPNALCGCKASSSCMPAQIDACACTFDDPNTCLTGGGNTCAEGCLDRDGTVATITSLRTQRTIDTFVIGFGDDLNTGVAADTLNAMAIAGGQARSCEKNANACGSDACDPATKLCSTKFYAADNADALEQVLRDIISRTGNPCEQKLVNPPSDPRFISVIVDGVTLTPGTDYTYDGALTVTIGDPACAKLLNSTPQQPVTLDIRAVSKL